MKKHKTSTLAALTSTALTLPAYADVPPEQSKFSYRYSQYKEDSMPTQRVAFGSNKRFSIDIHQSRFESSLGNKWSISIDYQHETLSGASPWTIVAGVNSAPHTVGLSGASISEKRSDIATNITRYYAKGQTSLALAKSNENDYKSNSFGLSTQRAFNNNHTRASVSISHSIDDIKPTIGVIPVNFESGDKRSYSYFIGASQIINRHIIVRGGASYTHIRGDLSDPYKLEDSRPENRHQQAYTLGYKQHFEKTSGTLGTDYRFYTDSWGVRSHTLELSWNQQWTENWHVIPSIRYYSQYQANFFSNTVRSPSDPNFGSTDYRLSTFDATTLGLEINYTISKWRLIASAKNYNSSESTLHETYSFDVSPALVDFTVYSVGFDYAFN